MKLISLAALLCVLACGNSMAAFETGAMLYGYIEHCDNPDNSEESKMKCSMGLGYISGVHDSGDDRFFCSPDKATRQQIVDVVKLWLKEHPGERKFNASHLVEHALARSWPCKQ